MVWIYYWECRLTFLGYFLLGVPFQTTSACISIPLRIIASHGRIFLAVVVGERYDMQLAPSPPVVFYNVGRGEVGLIVYIYNFLGSFMIFGGVRAVPPSYTPRPLLLIVGILIWILYEPLLPWEVFR